MANTTLNLCTFNCKNVNTSVPELKNFCNSHDFVFFAGNLDVTCSAANVIKYKQ